MKICLFTDNHWSQNSSIVRGLGKKYSLRLENQIQSINWVEELAMDNECDKVICLGDFFDQPELTAQEISALQEINWNYLPHYFIVGNHEMGINNLSFNSANIFKLIPDAEVIDEPTYEIIDDGACELCFLPYVLECNRKPLCGADGYFTGYIPDKQKRIILSHNDIKGFNFGGFISQAGFDVNDIDKSCDMFLNGHLHNGGKLTDKIINLGNLTGQNFSEDANKYDHMAYILDTDTLELNAYINPHAFNFYKLDLTNSLDALYKIRPNAVLSIKAYVKDLETIRKFVNNNRLIISSRIIVQQEVVAVDQTAIESLSVDHLQKFKEYILENLGSGEAVLAEVSEVVK